MRLMPGLALVLSLAGCSLLPAPPPPTVLHDLGATPEQRTALPWQLEVQVVAPPWLDDGQVHYRYSEATRLAAYRDHRWAAPPSALLARRLRDRLAPAAPGKPGRWLGIELVVFEQRFVDNGAEWRAVMEAFGVAPRRTSDFDLSDLPIRRERRFGYRCGCAEHQLSATRHNRVVRGQSRYRCRSCGQQLIADH